MPRLFAVQLCDPLSKSKPMQTIYLADPTKADQAATLHQLLRFVQAQQLTVTSGEYIDAEGHGHWSHSGHSSGSLHYGGRAVDVSGHGLTDARVVELAHLANAEGINLFDERHRPVHGVWTGPHLHLSISPLGTHEL